MRKVDIHVARTANGEYYFYFSEGSYLLSSRERPAQIKCLKVLSLVDNASKKPIWTQSLATGSECRDIRMIRFGEGLSGYSNRLLTKTLRVGVRYRLRVSASGTFGELVFTA